jgi:inorganic pyrophosphatase
MIAQLQHFLEHYKDLEPKKWVKPLAGATRTGRAA